MKVKLLTAFVVAFIYMAASVSFGATITYQYDDLHRLTHVERSDGTVTVYEYDDLGNRTAMVVSTNSSAPTALFSASPTSGDAPLPVTFTDNSIGDITSWSWDFGDGETSTTQNPGHTYQNSGTYTVSLTVTGPSGSDTMTKTDYITVNIPDSPNISVSPDSHNFGSIYVSSTSTVQSFIISNTGMANLDISSVTLSGADTSEFNIENDYCTGQSLANSENCTVDMTFSPTSEGLKSANLSIQSNDPDSPILDVPLSGSGVRQDSTSIPYFDAPFNNEYTGTAIWHSLNLVAGQGVTIILDAHLTIGYLDFGLYDIYGNELAGSNDSAIYDGESGIAGRTVESSGVYYVKVWGSTDAVGNYDLAVYKAWFNAGVTDSDRSFYSTQYTARYIASGNYNLNFYNNHRFSQSHNRHANIRNCIGII